MPHPLARALARRAGDVAVALMGVMFVSFLLQIFFRYVLDRPLGWTEEVIVLCWVWMVLWGASFIVPEHDEIRFDIVYGIVPARVQRAFDAVASAALVVLLVWSLPATWRYIAFMRREHSAYLGMRFDVLYSVYLVFAVACIVVHARRAWRALRGAPVDPPPAAAGTPP